MNAVVPQLPEQQPECDYSRLAPSIAKDARATAQRIRERNRAAIIDTGRDLIAIKGKLEHGLFGSLAGS